MPYNDEDNESEVYSYEVDAEQSGMRLDKGLSALCHDISRTRLQALIQKGHVLVNGSMLNDPSCKLDEGDVISFLVPDPVEAYPQAEHISLDIIFEDNDLLVINKPAGLVVHPGAGNTSGTLVNALLHHCADSLSGIGGVMRPGIVHRLDKDTTGLIVVAKNDFAHKGLSAQLQDRSLSRVYHALVFKTPMPVKGVIDHPIGRDPRNRLRMTIKGQGAREARTFYHVLEDFGGAVSLVECKLESGRTHQIRVHMQALKHPLIGDPVYGPQPNGVVSALKKAGYENSVIDSCINFPRQALHAKAISFIHPRTDDEVSFECPYPEDFSKLLKRLEK